MSYAAQLLRTALLLHASRVRGQTRCATPRSRASLMRGGRRPRAPARASSANLQRSSSMVEDGSRLRLPSADAATGAYTAELELDLGNLLAVDSRGPDPGAIQVGALVASLRPPFTTDTRAGCRRRLQLRALPMGATCCNA